ncbi:MAG: gamma carbonic anhydrase family protein [Spirochaetes bacterium]|nr:gamma carbonic anhydrase family protein [Spirochaetota bacterium]
MIYSFAEKTPLISKSGFIAENATVLGDVTIGDESSIWYGTVVRGDVHSIRIGAQTNIQDLSMIHVTGGKFATAIGDRVTIGHRVIVHGATLMDDAFVGMGAIILDGAIVEPFGFVAAGALIPPGFVVKSGELAIGSPAKLLRPIREDERAMMVRTWKNYVAHAKLHSRLTRVPN